MTSDSLFTETVTQIFTDHSSPETVRDAEQTGYSPMLWSALAEAGLPWVGIDEKDGGQGGTASDAIELVRLAGYFAAPVPLAETTLIGGPVLAEAGLPLPSGQISVVPAAGSLSVRRHYGGWTLDGTATRVPWARVADRLVAVCGSDEGPVVASIPVAAVSVTPGRNLANEPRDTVVADLVRLDANDIAPSVVDSAVLVRRAALARAAAMAGALERVLDISTRYASERVQFGRAIAKFGATQHHLVRIAEHTATTRMAVEMAAASRAGFLDVATAKITAGEAAEAVTAASHQVHGALGMTREHVLQLFTRRLWSYVNEFGTTHDWKRLLGEQTAACSAEKLWLLLST